MAAAQAKEAVRFVTAKPGRLPGRVLSIVVLVYKHQPYTLLQPEFS
jgi:hypothetical protein